LIRNNFEYLKTVNTTMRQRETVTGVSWK